MLMQIGTVLNSLSPNNNELKSSRNFTAIVLQQNQF